MRPLSIEVECQRVSGLLQVPPSARAVYVMAHGAGAGMSHPFLAQVAADLAERGVATLRYQFPYMESGSKRPDPPRLAQATVRSAVAAATRSVGGLPIIAGGRSFGGRMTSQAQAQEPLPGVVALAFLAFPLHAAGKPSDERGQHLFGIRVPLLFLQGSNDKLADLSLLQALVERLGPGAALTLLPQADHSFHVPVRSGRTDAQVRSALVDAFVHWMDSVLRP